MFPPWLRKKAFCEITPWITQLSSSTKLVCLPSAAKWNLSKRTTVEKPKLCGHSQGSSQRPYGVDYRRSFFSQKLINLAAPCLSCSVEDVWSSLWPAGSFIAVAFGIFFFFFSYSMWDLWLQHMAYLVANMQNLSCGIWDLVPWPGMEPGPPAMGAQS